MWKLIMPNYPFVINMLPDIKRKEQCYFLDIQTYIVPNNFYIYAVHLDTITVYYSPTNAQVIVLKTVLKFTLK